MEVLHMLLIDRLWPMTCSFIPFTHRLHFSILGVIHIWIPCDLHRQTLHKQWVRLAPAGGCPGADRTEPRPRHDGLSGLKKGA